FSTETQSLFALTFGYILGKKKRVSRGSSGKALIRPLMTLFPPLRFPFKRRVVSDLETPMCLASSLADHCLTAISSRILSIFGFMLRPPFHKDMHTLYHCCI